MIEDGAARPAKYEDTGESSSRAARKVVCILGTPRSGSSLTARMLDLAGLYLGDSDEQVAPGPGNPTGFWELRRVGRLNMRILRTLGIGVGEAAPLPPGWEHSPDLAAEREEARTIADEVFAGHEAWGWKDPRSSLTLPLWRQVVSPTHYVICVRNPVDGVASGLRFAAERGVTLDEDAGYYFWKCYIASAIANTAGTRRLFVAYENYFDDWRAAAERLARFAGLASPIGGEREQAISAFFDDRLRHHETPPAETMGRRELPESVRTLYAALQPYIVGAGDDLVETAVTHLDELAHQILAAH